MLLALTFSLINLNLLAAPAMTSPLCVVKANVLKIEQRERKYTPESWRKQWNLPKSITYTDVTLDIEKISGDQCSKETLSKNVFQLKSNETLKVGSCIIAKTQFSGDEFRIGQWLWDIKDCK